MARGDFGRSMSKAKRKEMFAELAKDFIAQLEKGEFGAWGKSWIMLGMDGMPHNVRKTPYRGINTIILWIRGFEYTSSQWGTFDQWKKLSHKHAISKGEFELKDGNKGPWKKSTEWYGVKSGESGTTVIFWKPTSYSATRENKETGEDETYQRASFMMRTYTVFNRDQTGLPELENVAGAELVEEEFNKTEQELETCIEWYMENTKGGPIELKHGGDRAFYVPSSDRIAMPKRKQFEANVNYLAVKGHECIHSTGHPVRLNRANMNKSTRFGDEDYAFEELIAEFGSAMLMGSFGIGGELRHVEYLGHWVKILKDDPEALMRAATKAQKAVDFMIDPWIEKCRADADLTFKEEYCIWPSELWNEHWVPEHTDEILCGCGFRMGRPNVWRLHIEECDKFDLPEGSDKDDKEEEE